MRASNYVYLGTAFEEVELDLIRLYQVHVLTIKGKIDRFVFGEPLAELNLERVLHLTHSCHFVPQQGQFRTAAHEFDSVVGLVGYF